MINSYWSSITTSYSLLLPTPQPFLPPPPMAPAAATGSSVGAPVQIAITLLLQFVIRGQPPVRPQIGLFICTPSAPILPPQPWGHLK